MGILCAASLLPLGASLPRRQHGLMKENTAAIIAQSAPEAQIGIFDHEGGERRYYSQVPPTGQVGDTWR